MASINLPAMSASQQEGWLVLLDLADSFPDGWCLVGGQMVWLLAAEHHVEPLRTTEDVDVVVDVRADRAKIRKLCRWLEAQNLELETVSSAGVGHRFARVANPGPGTVMFDVLAPEGLSSRVSLMTSKGARTLAAPGTRAALNSAEPIEVSVGTRTNWVRRPALLAAITVKAAATQIPSRSNPDRDWGDAAFLLSLVRDPAEAAQGLTKAQRRHLRPLSPLLDTRHSVWQSLGAEHARLGRVTLEFLLGE